MDYVQCPHCGNATPANQATCVQCGRDVEPGCTCELSRNAFVSFWLWLCLVCNGLVAILSAILFAMMLFGVLDLGLPSLFYYGFSTVTCALAMFALWKLLQWRRYGFYIIAGLTALNTLVLLIMSTVKPILVVTSGIVPIAILYLVLQISSHGVPYWDAMARHEAMS